MIASLSEQLGAALGVGDLAAAKVAHEAIAKLVGSNAEQEPKAVVDLATERRRRGEQ